VPVPLIQSLPKHDRRRFRCGQRDDEALSRASTLLLELVVQEGAEGAGGDQQGRVGEAGGHDADAQGGGGAAAR